MSKPGEWWDRSWNPIEGCSPISEACEHCWALAMLRRFRGQPAGSVEFYHERLNARFLWGKPRRIFVGSLTDLFQDFCLFGQGYDIVDSIFTITDLFPQHTFIFLTKRPQTICNFLFDSKRGAFGSNSWLLITTENQARFDERIPYLEQIPAAVRGISAEPLLGPLELGPAARWLNWVIVGGETGPGARYMQPDWVRSLRDQCQEAGIPFWFKHWGRWHTLAGLDVLYPRRLDGREWSELPEVPNDER